MKKISIVLLLVFSSIIIYAQNLDVAKAVLRMENNWIFERVGLSESQIDEINKAKFKFKSSFKTYCYRIARNNAIDILRKNNKYKKIVNAATEHTTLKEFNKNEIEQKLQLKEDVLELLLKLNKKEKELILLKDIEGLSIKEIKQIVKIPEGTIKSRLHRAREKLITLYKI